MVILMLIVTTLREEYNWPLKTSVDMPLSSVVVLLNFS